MVRPMLVLCYMEHLAELQGQWDIKGASHTFLNLKVGQALKQATSFVKGSQVARNGQANEQMVEALMK